MSNTTHSQPEKTTRNPWLWIPTLYFAEGIPYFLVNNISVMMFTRMGVPNGEMALFTSLLYLPWTIKPFWSPFIDIIKTKRWWIVSMQLLMTAAFVLLTVTIPHPTPEMIASGTTPVSLFTVMLLLFIITAFASATHDIAADGFYMLALTQHRQAAFVGARSVFYRLSSIFGQGVLLVIAGLLETKTQNIPLAWQLTLLVTSVIFALISLWHVFMLPKPDSDKSSMEGKESNAVAIIKEFGRTFATFFKKPGFLLAMIFMLVYRLPEAFLIKMINPFLVAKVELGGLGLTTETVGLVYGTIGVAFLMVGGILGGIFASRVGLKKSMWWMAACMTLPCFSFVYLAMCQPDNLIFISIAIAIEQFGYGFGFTAYMLYMMYFSEGEFKTSHYAICTAFMALSMMIPGMFAGYLQEALGYQNFFWMVIACCVATVIVTIFVRRQVNEDYGKK
ncbi:MAG: MFS transporter [Paludibacteraceae bacterium]|nr:MFS transporter [Paludibacteraceae bacterium]